MRNLLSVIILTACAGMTRAQTFEFVLNDANQSEAQAVCDMDGSYIIGGLYEKSRRRADFAYLMKLDPKGDTVWTRKIGGTLDARDAVIDLEYFDKEHFIVLMDLDKRVTVTLMNQDGEKQWTYTDSLAERSVSITRTKDDGVVVSSTCRIRTESGRKRSICVTKLDKNGNRLWSQFVGHGKQLKSYTITSTPAGGILVNARNKTDETYNSHLILLDADGEEIWQKPTTQHGIEYAFDLKTDSHGNIFLAGDGDQQLPILVKLDRDANLLWKHQYQGEAGSFRAYALAFTNDQGVVLAGRTSDAQGFLLKTDQDGKREWLREFAGLQRAGFNDVIQLIDGGYLAVGVTLDSNTLTAYVIKTDQNGHIQ